MNGASLETQVEWLALRTDHGESSHSYQRIRCGSRPSGDRPPAIQLAHLIEVRSRYHHRLPVRGAADDVGEGNGESMPGEKGVDIAKSICRKFLPVFSGDDDVGAVLAEFLAQFGLYVDVEIEHCRCYRRSDHHREQSRGSAPTAKHRCPKQHAEKHGGMRRVLAASGDILQRVHASPRRAYTGSNFTARRIASALPAKV